MKRFISITLISVVCVMTFVWNFFPEAISRVLLDLNNRLSGLSAKIIETEIGNIHHLEGGKGETVVLLHGIYARKEHWADLSRGLNKQFRVIALDLPGFGDNQRRISSGLPIKAIDLTSAGYSVVSKAATIAPIELAPM